MDNRIIASNNDIIFYKNNNGDTSIELLINGETLWVSQKTMSEIFDVDRTVITKHLKNIFDDGELDKNQVCAKIAHTANDGKTYYERVDAEKVNMGLTTWKEAPDGMIYKYDVSIAKNYLNESELKKLNNLTMLFLDYAETMAEEEQIITMKNWIDETDNLLKFRKKEILKDSGKISHKQAVEKANEEYEKFKAKQDLKFVSSMDKMYQKYLEETKPSKNTKKI